MSSQLNDLRLQVERLDYDNKESVITIDILNERNRDTAGELEEVKKQLSELRIAQKDLSADDKEKRKQEKMALMMAKFDAVGCSVLLGEDIQLMKYKAGCLLREGRATSTCP